MKINYKKNSFVIHIIFWIGYFAFYYSIYSFREQQSESITRSLIYLLPHIGLFYWNAYFLMNKYFFTKKYKLYTIYVIASFLFISLVINIFDYYLIIQYKRWAHHLNIWLLFLRSSVPTLGILSLSIAYKTTQLAFLREKEAAELRNENLETELKFLKSQINPHFLFNVLHNIYTLSYLKSDIAPKMILKLSDMLRYITYEGNKHLVPISKEIEYIRNYIDLQKLKQEKNENITVFIEVSTNNIQVPPMLFVPFIENSFKHSKIEDTEKGWVKIFLKTDREHINFKVSNSIPEKEYTKDKTGGIGLKNVKRRLDLIYGKNYQLNIDSNKEVFTVDLQIKL